MILYTLRFSELLYQTQLKNNFNDKCILLDLKKLYGHLSYSKLGLNSLYIKLFSLMITTIVMILNQINHAVLCKSKLTREILI